MDRYNRGSTYDDRSTREWTMEMYHKGSTLMRMDRYKRGKTYDRSTKEWTGRIGGQPMIAQQENGQVYQGSTYDTLNKRMDRYNRESTLDLSTRD
jgi:hypothetical protein